jgi:hypothetical protein
MCSFFKDFETFIFTLKMLGYEISERVGGWSEQRTEYAFLINDDVEYRMEWVKNKVSYVLDNEGNFNLFVIRLNDNFVDIEKLNILISESDSFMTVNNNQGLSVIYDELKSDFVLNCTNEDLIKDILYKFLTCVR